MRRWRMSLPTRWTRLAVAGRTDTGVHALGQVVSVAQFNSWAHSTEVQLASVTKQLPPYATVYDPTVIPQLTKGFTSGGIFGAGGSLYGPQYGNVQP